MSNEYAKGDRLIARGPSTPPNKNDVDGVILEVRRDGMIVVQEEKYDTPTVVNPNGGWLVLTVLAAAGVVALVAA